MHPTIDRLAASMPVLKKGKVTHGVTEVMIILEFPKKKLSAPRKTESAAWREMERRSNRD